MLLNANLENKKTLTDASLRIMYCIFNNSKAFPILLSRARKPIVKFDAGRGHKILTNFSWKVQDLTVQQLRL